MKPTDNFVIPTPSKDFSENQLSVGTESQEGFLEEVVHEVSRWGEPGFRGGREQPAEAGGGAEASVWWRKGSQMTSQAKVSGLISLGLVGLWVGE